MKNVQDFTSWVCRACETPDIERECCLCPLKGMPFRFNILADLGHSFFFFFRFDIISLQSSLILAKCVRFTFPVFSLAKGGGKIEKILRNPEK